MKNLDIFTYKDTKLPFESASIEQNKNNTVKHILLDNGDLFLYDNHHLFRYESGILKNYYDTNFKIDQIFSDELLNVFYIISNQHIRSISYEGDTQCYDTDIFALYEYNCEAEDEIINAALSPDKEHIVLLTKSNLVLTLLSNFKVIAEDNLLSSATKGEKESVNVGWGKVETQFKGSTKSGVQSVSNSDHVDDGPPSIAWCADSQLFAISFFSPAISGRQLKVYKVYGGHCSLQYTSKLIPGLESHLSWRPHVMSHLASTQRLPNKYALVFIEKNTEVKDLFDLRNVSAVRCLQWSQDGNILAVMTANNRVLLYTNSNWHWYLKQELSFSHPASVPVQLVWTSPSHCSVLHDSRLRNFSWKKLVNAACGVVAVIDANEVLVTDFNRGVIPPPMCTQRVTPPENSENINRVLLMSHKADDLLIMTSSGSLYSFKSGVWDKIIPEGENSIPQGEGKISQETEKSDGIFNKARVWNETELVFVRGKSDLCTMNIQNGSPIQTLCKAQFPIISVVVKSSSELILQLDNCDVIVYSRQDPKSSETVTKSNEDELKYREAESKSPETVTESHEAELKSHEVELKSHEATTKSAESTAQVAFTLPELCTHIDYASGHLLALSPVHILYDNGTRVLTDVSSFLLHCDWLLVTTLTHRLVLFRLVPGKPVEEGDGISRRLERGGTLVTVTTSCAAVLQMPRGNLETVMPRPLLLHLLSQLLSEKKYKEAYVQMRKHRIDLNLLVDYAPPDYNLLVAQVDNPAWLSNLIADLKSEDVTRQDAYYSEYYAKCALARAPIEDGAAPKSIAAICSRLRSALQSRDPVKYAHTLMHCAVKAGVWSEALAIARASSAALDFLILLHDVNSLYEVALRAYDLDLALQIAGKSQKDPKEYVPYLNRLRSLPLYRMKAEIDKQFGSYLSAVRHLSSGIKDVTTKIRDKSSDVTGNSDVTLLSRDTDDVKKSFENNSDITKSFADNSDVTEECLDLIRKHKLWSHTLDIFPKSSESYKTVVREYGLQLELKGRPEEAGLMYERAAAYDEALRCFVKAGAWRSALIAAGTLNYGSLQLDSLYVDLCRSLNAKRDVTGLVSLLEQRRDDTETRRDVRISADIIVSIVSENPWLAVEMVRQYAMENLIESDIKPALTELHLELSEEISALERSFASTLARLLLVRSLPKPVARGEGGAGDEEMSDWGSETGSTLSTRSGHTGTSTSSRGRRKRKQDRKLWSLKEGNPREEISLVKTLAENISALENYTGRVKQLCLALVRLEMDPLAHTLQSTLKTTLGVLELKRDVIWPPPEENQTSVDDARVNLPPVSSVLHHWELECLKSVTQ